MSPSFDYSPLKTGLEIQWVLKIDNPCPNPVFWEVNPLYSEVVCQFVTVKEIAFPLDLLKVLKAPVKNELQYQTTITQ